MEAIAKIFSLQFLRWNNHLFPRLLLMPLFVLLCYQFSWAFLRTAGMNSVLYTSSCFGLETAAVSEYSFAWNDNSYAFYISCTMIDVFFASIPLLWKTGTPVWKNILLITALFSGTYVVNIVRIVSGFILLDVGMPWLFAHKVMGGIAYFIVLVWLVKHNHFLEFSRGARVISCSGRRGKY
jgi:exosortase/archaeosortase family protein